MQKDRKEPLYRKVNKTTVSRRCWNSTKNPDSKYDRNTKKGIKRGMTPKHLTGYDYTPLYRFLLSRVGMDWDKTFSEASSRLDNTEAIYHLVAKSENDRSEYVNCGESSKYNGLYVDDNNILQKVNPNLKNTDLYPTCHCCTHTFNGEVLKNKYEDTL